MVRIGRRPADRVRGRLLVLLGVVALLVTGCGGSSEESSTSTRPESSSTTTSATTTTVVGQRPSGGCETSSGAGDEADPAADGTPASLDIDGVERSYVLSTEGTDPGVPAPLIVLLHGMGSSPEDVNTASDLPAKAGEQGVMVLTPQALGEPAMWQPSAQGLDAAFVDQLIEQVSSTRCVDEARIGVMGFSVGAAFAGAYSCARQDQIAAIATVTVEFPAGCEKPMSIMAFHGTGDPVIAYGNTDPTAPGGVTGTEANMAVWAETAGCQATPTVSEVDTEVTRLEWSDCSDGAEVVLFRILDGGHAWPGGQPAPVTMAGTPQIDATAEALKFFGRHHLP